MAIGAILLTYVDGTLMDSYTAGIVNIDPVENPLTSNRPVVKMTQPYQEVFYDTLYNATSDHTVIEGSDTGKWWNQAPTSILLNTEILRHGYKVSRSEYKAVSKTGVNPFVGERKKAAKVLKNVYEERAFLSTQASGATATARSMKGVISQINTGQIASAGSLAFTASGLESQIESAWAAGAQIDELYMPIKLKRKFAAFLGSETAVNADHSDKRIINRKDVYESDTANEIKVFKSRVLSLFATISSYSKTIVVGVQGDLVKLGIFDGVQVYETEPDARYAAYLGKMELEANIILGHPNGGFAMYNYQ